MSAAVDVAELDVLYRDLSSYQSEPAGESMVAEEMRVALSSTELITFPAESVGEMTVVFLTPPILATTGLRIITSPTSPMLVIEPVLPGVVSSLTSIMAGVLVSMKTPPRPPAISLPSPTNASATSSPL